MRHKNGCYDSVPSYSVPKEYSHHSHQNVSKPSGKIVNHIMDESENNEYYLDLSDFESECSLDDCDDRSFVYTGHGNHYSNNEKISCC